jgi:hypothetical protein
VSDLSRRRHIYADLKAPLAILLSRANPIIQSSIKIGAGCPFPNTPRIATMADHE